MHTCLLILIRLLLLNHTVGLLNILPNQGSRHLVTPLLIHRSHPRALAAFGLVLGWGSVGRVPGLGLISFLKFRHLWVRRVVSLEYSLMRLQSLCYLLASFRSKLWILLPQITFNDSWYLNIVFLCKYLLVVVYQTHIFPRSHIIWAL